MTDLVTSSQSRVEFDPSYNETGITESEELTASFEQYWQTRKTACKEAIERLKPLAANGEAELQWRSFCAYRTGFLKRYVAAGVKTVGLELQAIWGPNHGLIREAKRALEMELWCELWIPCKRSPLTFACVSTGKSVYELREAPYPAGEIYFNLGDAYLTIFLGSDCLFTVVPSGKYVTLTTFEFTKDGITWNSGDAIPKAFGRVSAQFQADLRDAERSFAPLMEIWHNRSSLALKTDELARIDQSAEAWRRVQIPEAQKLDILRRMELFEKGDPGAPRGLLLKGTSGNGKSLIARTIADTLNCEFQKLSLPDIKDEHLGASPKRVREIWNHAKSYLPAIIFVDDCDRVFGRRGAAETDVIAEDIVGAFLPEWDGVEQTPGIMVIGATNRPDVVDDAILSRFGWEMEIALPDAHSRVRILQQELQAIGVEVDLPVELTSLTQGMSGRDLRNLASSAKSLAHPGKLTSEHLLLAMAAAKNKGTVEAEFPATWDTLAVESAILDRLKLLSALLKDVEKWQAQGVRVPRSLLLIGPDAGIKRRIAHTLKYESGRTLLAPTVADLKANFSGQSGNRVKMIAERARSSSPSILLLERLEFIAPSRDTVNASDALTNEIVGQLTQEFDHFQDRLNHVFLLGATSNPHHVDAEVLRCFDERIVIAVPDTSTRVKLFKTLLTGKRLSFDLQDGAVFLAQLTEGGGFESNELEAWVQSAEQRALMRAVQNGGPDHYMMALEDFEMPKRAAQQ